jgi:hypothetical protein
MNDTTKMVTKDGLVRVTREAYQIMVEELPRKPVQKQLRAWRVHTGWQCNTMHWDEYLPQNLLMWADIAEIDSFAVIVQKLEGALEKAAGLAAARSGVALAAFERPHPVTGTQYYLKVTPETEQPIEVQGRDFVFTVGWSKWSVFSPSSDFNQPDPYYSEYESSSPAAARKLYKILKADPNALRMVSWSSLSGWLRERNIGYETHHSQWT